MNVRKLTPSRDEKLLVKCLQVHLNEFMGHDKYRFMIGVLDGRKGIKHPEKLLVCGDMNTDLLAEFIKMLHNTMSAREVKFEKDD